ncbi:hypothetical protein FQN54_008164 [Arachnomyces sp. PD_36]|nr:hypothetical protein FQN54_008164 [Arachnomyces sp. PD_36]
MSRYQEAGTPCPASWMSNSSAMEDEFDLYEDTAVIDFTTEIRAPVLQGTRPRRATKTAAPKIYQDSEGIAPAAGRNATLGDPVKRRTMNKNSTMLAQPAQRFPRPKVSFAVNSPVESSSKENTPVLPTTKPQSSSKKRSPLSSGLDDHTDPGYDRLKKDVRRDTIYIPEDTTVPSVFMGIFSPVKPSGEPKPEAGLEGLEAHIARKRQQRRSVAAAPRRGPLQPATKPVQETTTKVDIAGRNGGKENVPPGGILASDGKNDKESTEELPVFELPVKRRAPLSSTTNPKVSSGRSAKSKGTAKTSAPDCQKRNAPGVKPKTNTLERGNATRKDVRSKTIVKKSPLQSTRSSTSPALSKQAKQRRAPSKLTIPRISQPSIDLKYPLLTEDISNCAMYEDNWLNHQEVAITQLVNSLFNSANGNQELQDGDPLRHGILGVYQDPSFSLLYKRLQASLLYGALAIPKDLIPRGDRLKNDLGLKRTFLKLWLDTYDLLSLKAVAETVVGRKMIVQETISKVSSDNPSSSPAQKDKRALKRTLESFLETFLLQNKDAEHNPNGSKGGETGAAGWAYRRTVLRSLLMIILLDKARLCPELSLPRCLFAPSSPHKSSEAVLQALGHLLLPTIGDITRPLSHLDYNLQYKQHPLQEYEYKINNLAVDLRDGVLVTRLVELLLYPSASFLAEHQQDRDETVAMPTGEILSLLQGEHDWPLSQHLKFPCMSRAAKLFNVQISLSALSGVKGVGVIVQDIRPEDIVDGYREKTIALLWGLVGKWGLEGLLDWDDVRKEIKRLQQKIECSQNTLEVESQCDEGEEEEDFEEGYQCHQFLLKRWASCLAQLHGVRVDNLTTSFADGKVFESIVDEYEWYILGCGARSPISNDKTATVRRSVGANASLASRLKALGCSAQFVSLVAPASASARIFDQDFTLAALAFLCSRLLPASRRPRAAVVLQGAWRQILAKRELHRRILAKKVAVECETVVATRERLLAAKEVIVKWWRTEKARKEKCARRNVKTSSRGQGARGVRRKGLPRQGSRKLRFNDE